MAGEQNPASASRSSAFLAVETYRQARVQPRKKVRCREAPVSFGTPLEPLAHVDPGSSLACLHAAPFFCFCVCSLLNKPCAHSRYRVPLVSTFRDIQYYPPRTLIRMLHCQQARPKACDWRRTWTRAHRFLLIFLFLSLFLFLRLCLCLCSVSVFVSLSFSLSHFFFFSLLRQYCLRLFRVAP